MKNKKGVTLIVLVITVIVMAILAATVITSLNDTNILDKAKEVAFETDMLAYKDSYDMYVITNALDNTFFDETELNLSYGSEEYTKILGEVPEKYQESLKIINGKLVYITTDEKESQIADKLDMLPNKMKIINNLTNCTTNNTTTEVEYDKSYEAILTAKTGYTLKQVTVVMGSQDITNTVYNSTTNKISISSVTDKVIITATTNANVYTITNNLTNVTTSNTNTEATAGTNYTAILTANTEHTLKTVNVTMNGVDITSTAYNSQTRTVTISSITGNIIITARAKVNGIYAEESATEWTGTIATSYSSGDGSKSNPYCINSAEELAYLAKKVNEGEDYSGKYFLLINDISLDEAIWVPIGNGENRVFKGIFNGYGHTMMGVILRGDYAYRGIFGHTGKGCEISGLTIDNSSVEGTAYVGALVGYSEFTKFDNIIVENPEISATRYLGSMCGYSEGCTFTNINTKDVILQNATYAGGIVGYTDSNTFSNCLAENITVDNCKYYGNYASGINEQ